MEEHKIPKWRIEIVIENLRNEKALMQFEGRLPPGVAFCQSRWSSSVSCRHGTCYARASAHAHRGSAAESARAIVHEDEKAGIRGREPLIASTSIQ